MADPQALRERIAELREDLARAEGEEESLSGQVDERLRELRKVLGCKRGKEREALDTLRTKIEEGEEEVSALIDEAEEAREGAQEDDGE